MVFKYSKKAINKQYFFIVLLLILPVVIQDYLVILFSAIVAVILTKDVIKIRIETIHIDKNSIKIYHSSNMVREILFTDLEYIVVKGKKWLVLHDGKKKLTITDQLEDLHILAKKIIDYNRKNKKLFVDPTITEVFQVRVKLNSENHIIG